MTDKRLIEWRTVYCRETLYLGKLYIGHVYPVGYGHTKWDAWFVGEDDDGISLGWFDSETEAKLAIERALFEALPPEMAALLDDR
ncbi:MAG TPA: hypothetical protein VN922_15035 [Bacteroidia bacterium]|nr:hypothetical protein [Bacteroidia bacterium]